MQDYIEEKERVQRWIRLIQHGDKINTIIGMKDRVADITDILDEFERSGHENENGLSANGDL